MRGAATKTSLSALTRRGDFAASLRLACSTQCIVRPCVARSFAELSVSFGSMYPAFDCSGLCAKPMDISTRAIFLAAWPRPSHSGHQYSHAPGRPNFHFVSSSRRPPQEECIDLTALSQIPHRAAPLPKMRQRAGGGRIDTGARRPDGGGVANALGQVRMRFSLAHRMAI